MNLEPLENCKFQDSKFVEVLTSERSSTVIGYRLGGASPGPNILIAGHAPIADAVYDQLVGLATLPWMRGTLYLISLNALDGQEIGESLSFVPEDHIDEVLFLPYAGQPEFIEAATKTGYWSILQVCARMGMIDGRGVGQYPRH